MVQPGSAASPSAGADREQDGREASARPLADARSAQPATDPVSTEKPVADAAANGGSTTLLQTFKAVGSALFGVRSSKGHQTDIARLNPIHVILAGLLAVAVFIGVLIFFVRIMLRASGAA